MASDDGCVKSGFMLLVYNAALVGACYAFSLAAPVIPYLLGGALLVGIVAAVARRPDPPPAPPAFEAAEFRLPPPTPPPRTPEIVFVEMASAAETPRCLICRSGLGDDVIHCWRCRTPHHRRCFRYTGECAVYACGCRRYRRRLRTSAVG